MASTTIIVQPTPKFAVLEVRSTRHACVHHAALDVLTTPEPAAKARKSFDAYDAWQRGELTAECPDVVEHPRDGHMCVYASQVPDRPARPANMQVVGMSRVKTGKSKYTIHAVAHAESYAIDLMWDLILRFGPSYKMPLDFYNDFVRIAAEEAAHFQSWADRLVEMGSYYGEFPCHDGLWEDAAATSDDLLARLALVHMVHEARGLDVFPASRQKLVKSRDEVSTKILEHNVQQEVGHVGAALKWFTYTCEKRVQEPISTFHSIVRDRFRGSLLPPFNDEMRAQAGMTPDWYLPLAS